MSNERVPAAGIVPQMPAATSAWQNMNKATQPKPRVQTSSGNFSQRGTPSGPFTPAFLQAMARSPIPTIPQAHYSTYASRIRTGATLLVQPILNAAAPPIIDDGVPAPRSTAHAPSANTGRSTRRGGHKSYVETGSGDELEEEKHGPEGSDDSDFQASGGTRTMIRKMGKGTTGGSSAPGKVLHQPEPKPQVEIDKSYLGTVPPPNLIYSRPAHHVRLEPQCLFPEKLNAQAEQPTVLLPIRIELETDNARIRDCFTWNLHETLITPAQFANIFCADLELDMGYAEQVANQILAQIEEHAIMASLDLPVNTEREELMLHEDDAGPGDCRVVLQIDVQISTKNLLDHVEWDLRSNLTPEEFTAVLCADVGLSSEAKPMIAHAIHEELLKHKKDVIEWGVLEGGGEWKSHAAGLGNAWGRKGKGPKRMKGIWRDWAEILSGEYSPRIEELSAEELERRELERERAARRLRRETSKFQGAGTTGRRRNR